MVYQGSDVLWQHIRHIDINALLHFLVHVLDSMRLLQ